MRFTWALRADVWNPAWIGPQECWLHLPSRRPSNRYADFGTSVRVSGSEYTIKMQKLLLRSLTRIAVLAGLSTRDTACEAVVVKAMNSAGHNVHALRKRLIAKRSELTDGCKAGEIAVPKWMHRGTKDC